MGQAIPSSMPRQDWCGGTDGIYEISEYHGLGMSIQKWGISCLFALVLYEFDDMWKRHAPPG